jgi:hypothetical protein
MTSLSAEKNRLHKVPDDAGIRLGGVASDIKMQKRTKKGSGLHI